tara:strand:+ start:1922 stop:2344 length:423 start_codon:yes stop_codon:yes gene_type:complete
MAITFTNIIFDEIIENLAKLINDEFNIAVHYDEHKGVQSFLLTGLSDDFVTNLSTGVQREYAVEVNYQLKIGGQYTKNNIKQVSNVMERFKRLVFNNKILSNGSEWFDAQVSSINYEQNEDDETLLNGIANFTCQNIEVI